MAAVKNARLRPPTPPPSLVLAEFALLPHPQSVQSLLRCSYLEVERSHHTLVGQERVTVCRLKQLSS